MKSKSFTVLIIISFLIIIITQLKLINRPVKDNDEGIYLTSFLLIDRGNPAYKETYFSQPPGFLLSIYPGFILFGKTLQSARLTVGIWSVIGLLAAIWFGIVTKNQWTGLLTIAILFFIPVYTNQSLTFQSDILATTFSLISLVTLIKFKEKFNLRWFMIFTFFFNLAFWTKFDITIIPAALVFLFFIFQERNNDIKYVVRLLSILIIISLAFFVIFILPFGLKEVFYNSILLRFQAVTTSKTFLLFNYLQQNIVLFFIVLANLLLGIINWRKFNHSLTAIFIWSFFTFFLLLFYQPLFPHHLVMLVVPMTLLFSQLVSLLFKNKRKFTLLVLLLLAISLGNHIYLTKKTTSNILNAQQQKAVEIIIKYTKKNDIVVSDEEILNGLSGRLPPPAISDISFVRIKSNNLTSKNFQQIIDEYKPKLIIPWNGRLTLIDSLNEILTGYKKLTSFSPSKNIYIRIDK